MKRFAMIFVAAAMMFISSTPALAEPIAPSPAYSGELMFTYQGNDNPKGLTAMLGLINDWFNKTQGYVGNYLDDLTIFDKYDKGQSKQAILDLSFTNNKGGSWTSTEAIEFYAVKGGNVVAMYWIEGGAASGLWSTEHIRNGGGNVPDLSHMSVFNPVILTALDTPAPTPEPATVLLMGLGMAGLFAARRFKK